jgi:large subunit ribosomal protein L13
MKDAFGGPLKTYHAKPGEVEREWLLVDATDMVLGRLASQVAQILKGKRKPQYTPHVDTGDFVVVINAEQDPAHRQQGQHQELLLAQRLSRRPQGGLLRTHDGEKHPERVIEKAVKGMLPKNTLGRAMNRKLKVYAGPEHPHEAQKPRQITLEGKING